MSVSVQTLPSLDRITWYDEKDVFLFTRDIGENGPYVMASRIWYDGHDWFFFQYREKHTECKSNGILIAKETPELKLIIKAYEELIEREIETTLSDVTI